MTRNFAHRGFSGKYPENTMLAFEKAIEAGCDGIEFDVQMTKDRELVLIHDETVDRTTNGSGRVCDYTLEELKKLDASAGFVGIYGFNPIPTLREYCAMAQDKSILTNIELKNGVYEYEGMEQMVLDILDEYSMRDKVIISTFNHFSALRMKKLAPDMRCGLLEESWLIDPAGYVEKAGVECYHPWYCSMTEETVAALHAKGIEINVWTVNTEETMLQMLEAGVDGVITNFPDAFCKVRENFQNRERK